MKLGTTTHGYEFESPDATHTALFGKTGTGKSTLLEHLILDAMEKGHGMTILDPHGDLAERVLSFVPKHRRNDVIYLDPTDDRIVNINLFEKGTDPGKVADHFSRMMKNLFKESWGPRTEWIAKQLVRALMSCKNPVGFPAFYKLLSEPNAKVTPYRTHILESVEDPVSRRFFRGMSSWTPRFYEECVTPLLNKVTEFVANPYLAATLGAPRPSFSFREMMDTSKILVCNLSKGAMGDDASSILGSIIVSKLALAALSREDSHDRPLHVLFADEIQNFVHGVDLGTIFAQARKYGLCLVPATQTTEQIPQDVRSSLFGNITTLVAFRVSGEDAELLAKQIGGGLQPSALQDVPNYRSYVCSVIDGIPTQFQLIYTHEPLRGERAAKEKTKRESLARYGRPRKEVEKRIRKFLLR